MGGVARFHLSGAATRLPLGLWAPLASSGLELLPPTMLWCDITWCDLHRNPVHEKIPPRSHPTLMWPPCPHTQGLEGRSCSTRPLGSDHLAAGASPCPSTSVTSGKLLPFLSLISQEDCRDNGKSCVYKAEPASTITLFFFNLTCLYRSPVCWDTCGSLKAHVGHVVW